MHHGKNYDYRTLNSGVIELIGNNMLFRAIIPELHSKACYYL